MLRPSQMGGNLAIGFEFDQFVWPVSHHEIRGSPSLWYRFWIPRPGQYTAHLRRTLLRAGGCVSLTADSPSTVFKSNSS